MILTIDIGNTNLTIGCLNGTDVLLEERLSTHTLKKELEYAVDLLALTQLHHINLEDITGCIVSSVVPSLSGIIHSAVAKVIQCPVLILGPDTKTGLHVATDVPAELGADLTADAVAALHYYGAPLIIIDMGTSTTVSVLDDDGNYIGGMILPGLSISLDALVAHTSQLPDVSLKAPDRVICSETVSCMQSGIIYGQAAQLDGLIERAREEMGEDIPAIATGGLASCVVPWCREKITLDDDLILRGLGLIYQMNI